jgi:hypothetical protein
VLDRPDVFVPNVAGAWIYPDRATPAEVLELAHNCPSGAIQCAGADGAAMESVLRPLLREVSAEKLSRGR